MNNQSILVENVPIDWVIKKIKYVFDERKETNDPIQTDVLVSLTHDRGVILHSEKGDIGNKEKDDIKKYKIVHPGDIVVNSMNVIIGSSGLSDHFGLVSPVYYMLVKKDPNHDNKFFHYLFRSIVFQKSLIGVGNGILEHRMRVPIDKLGGHLIPLPSANEQKLISQYLDKKISQIDSLVEKIQKKIDLLKEQRTSLINHYVTKGLDPNVEMKDSGAEWIGEIPKHWELIKLKYLVSHNQENLPEVTDPNYEFHYIEIGDVDYIHGINVNEKISFSQSPSRARRIVKPNDVIISTVRTYLRAIGVIPDLNDIVCSTGFCVLRDNSGLIEQSYLSYVVKSEWFVSEVIGNSYGVSYPAINSSELVEFEITYPPQKEQLKIAKYLETQIQQVDRNILLEDKRTSLLKEYRQSLISSVVTGKVSVTEDMV